MSSIAQSANDLYQVVNGCKYAVIDFETDGLHPLRDNPTGMAVLTDRGAVYVPLWAYRTSDNPVTTGPIDPGAVATILRDSIARTVPVLGWNIKFDMHYLYKIAGFYPENAIDVQTGYWLLHEAGDLALKDVAGAITGSDHDSWKVVKAATDEMIRNEVLRERELWVTMEKVRGRKKTDARKDVATEIPMRQATAYEIPVDVIAPYCLKDVALTWWVWIAYVRPALQAEGMLDYFYSYEVPFTRTLWNMEQRGFALDTERLRFLEQDLRAQALDLETQFHHIAGGEVNMNSTEQLCGLFFDRLGFTPTHRRTKEGNPSLDVDALTELNNTYGRESSVFKLLLEHREVSKLARTYCSSLVDETYEGRLHTRFRQCGTVTGRLSSSEP